MLGLFVTTGVVRSSGVVGVVGTSGVVGVVGTSGLVGCGWYYCVRNYKLQNSTVSNSVGFLKDCISETLSDVFRTSRR